MPPQPAGSGSSTSDPRRRPRGGAGSCACWCPPPPARSRRGRGVVGGPGAAADAACLLGALATHEPAPEGTGGTAARWRRALRDAVARYLVVAHARARPGTKATLRVEDHRRMLRLRDYDPREGRAPRRPRSWRSGGSVRTRATPDALTGTLARGADQPRAQQLWLADIWGIDCMQEVWRHLAQGSTVAEVDAPASAASRVRTRREGSRAPCARSEGTRTRAARATGRRTAGPEPGLRRRVAREGPPGSPACGCDGPPAAPARLRGTTVTPRTLRRQRAAAAPLVR